MPSLFYYLIVSQTDYSVQLFEKVAKDSWNVKLIQGLDGFVFLPQFGSQVRLSMQNVYEDVKLRIEEEETDH